MANGKTNSKNDKVVMSELKFLISKDRVLQQLRECAENVKEGKAAVTIIPDNCCRLEPGNYTGEQMGAVIHFIADMLE